MKAYCSKISEARFDTASGRDTRGLARVSPKWMAALFVLAALFLMAPPQSRAQLPGHKKLPGLGKIESTGPTKGIFTGGVQTLDSRSKVLEVSSADGVSTAIFPITKKVKVSSIDGRKLKLASLTPGTNVIVHYQQQGGRRTVQQIVVVSKAPAKNHKGHSSS